MTNKQPITRNAKHQLTSEEVQGYTDNLLQSLQARDEIKAESKEVANTYKTRIAEQDLAIDKVTNLLRLGYEIRPFQCYLNRNFETGRREYIEFGTDRLIDTEPLNANDYQMQLEIDEQAIKENNEATTTQQEETLAEALFSPAGEQSSETDTNAKLEETNAVQVTKTTKKEDKAKITPHETIEDAPKVVNPAEDEFNFDFDDDGDIPDENIDPNENLPW